MYWENENRIEEDSCGPLIEEHRGPSIIFIQRFHFGFGWIFLFFFYLYEVMVNHRTKPLHSGSNSQIKNSLSWVCLGTTDLDHVLRHWHSFHSLSLFHISGLMKAQIPLGCQPATKLLHCSSAENSDRNVVVTTPLRTHPVCIELLSNSIHGISLFSAARNQIELTAHADRQ